uniref:Band 7 domain-containing protein n=1 Tax=Romanomermis culicivorax TaxID=13658 RepID=A0A915IVK0_ROMCU
MHPVAASSKKYKSNNNDDHVWSGLNYSSIFTYDSTEQFQSYFTYGSSYDSKEDNSTKFNYTYNDSAMNRNAISKKVDSMRGSEKFSRTSSTVDNDASNSGKENTFELILIFLSFLGILATMPFSLLICLKVIKDSERMIISRLGRFLPPRGPGITFIFPCIDEWRLLKIVEQTAVLSNLQASRITIGSPQASTCDKAVMEISVRFAFKITDPILCVNAAQNFDDSIRNMARTVMRKIIDKKYQEDLEKKMKFVEEDFKRQFNFDLQSWGVAILNVEIFDLKLLKKPASLAQDFLKAFLKQPQLTTAFFHSLLPTAGANYATPSIFSNDTLTPLTALSSLDGVKLNGNTRIKCFLHETDLGSKKKNMDVKTLAEQLNAACSCQPSLVSKLGRDVVYQVNCSSMGAFYLYASSLEPGSRVASIQCTTCPPPEINECNGRRNVEIYIDSDDLESVLLGIIDPMDLYTTGRLKVRGDLNLARKLRHLSECVKISSLV